MSFRGRLTTFFVLIVVLPMVAVAVLVADVTDESESGKADARLAAGLDTAIALYGSELDRAEALACELARDPALTAAAGAGNAAAADALAAAAVRETAAQSVAIAAGGQTLGRSGSQGTVGAASCDVQAGGAELTVTLSTTNEAAFLADVRRLTSRDAILSAGGRPLGGTVEAEGLTLPETGTSTDLDVGGESVRAATTNLAGPGALRLTLLTPVDSGGFLSSEPAVVGALLAFFLVALAFVLVILRALGTQTATMLDAARRIGGGDFSRRVPVVGRDEMAGLASEFNKMSDRLSAQMDELRRQQLEIDRSVQRIGEAFASGLDRDALLEIMIDTALGACAATYGCIDLRDETAGGAESGESEPEIREAVRAAEERALRDGRLVGARRQDAHALAAPLRRMGEAEEIVGVMALARRGREFQRAERDVFLYLIAQVASSIENIALHEQVSEQAVTDDLTGLSNKRRFVDALDREVARAERFGHPLSLLMLDIDDFKQINDTYGHLQGDAVLRALGRVLRAESRAADEPARYGGEEFAVALAETGLEGALEVAERIRARIEAESVDSTGNGKPIRITASIGAAAMPESGQTSEELIAAADAALYEAKTSGKNRVEATSAARKRRRATPRPAAPRRARPKKRAAPRKT